VPRPIGKISEPGAFATARAALRATGEHPEAAILIGLVILGVELLLPALAERAFGSRLLADWVVEGKLPSLLSLAAILAAGLPLALLLGVATALGVARTSRRSLGPGSVCAAATAVALTSLSGLGGLAAIAAGLAALAHGLATGGSLSSAGLFALLAGPGLLLTGASLAAGLLSLGRIGDGEYRFSTVGAAIADLLLDPPRSAGRLGALWLCALPVLLVAFLCGGSALLASGLPRLSLLLAHALCSGFALLWLARGTSLVIGRTAEETVRGSLGASMDR
jgi:hypothetical protein